MSAMTYAEFRRKHPASRRGRKVGGFYYVHTMAKGLCYASRHLCETRAYEKFLAWSRKASALERHQHQYRGRAGRFIESQRCDACDKPVGTAYYTDDAVCGSTDGPGFYICERKRCARKLEGLSVDERRAIYVGVRAARSA